MEGVAIRFGGTLAELLKQKVMRRAGLVVVLDTNKIHFSTGVPDCPGTKTASIKINRNYMAAESKYGMQALGGRDVVVPRRRGMELSGKKELQM